MTCKKCGSTYSKPAMEYAGILRDENENPISGEYMKYSCPSCGYFYFKEVKKDDSSVTT